MIVRVCVAALLLLPAAAFAQGSPGPFGGLFGRTPERTGQQFTALEFRNAWGAQWDDALLIDEALPEDERPQSGYTGGVNAGLVFERLTDRLHVRSQAGATRQEFFRTPPFGATSYDAAALVRGEVSTRFDLEASARYFRSPFFRLVPSAMLAGSPVAIPGDPFIARRLTNDSYDVSGGFTSRYSKRSTLTASVSRRETRFQNAASTFDVVGAHAQWKRQLNREFALRAGYGRERIRQEAKPGDEFVHEVLDLGVDFLKSLSLARRTTLGINTQTSVIKRPVTGRRYRLNGSLMLSRHFARTWHATAGVSRSTEFMPGFLEPLLQDAVNFSVSGMMSRRAEWFATVNAGRGQFGFDDSGRFLTGHATTRLNWALMRHLGIYGQYAFYYYELPRSTAAISLLNQVSRQSVSVGLATWVPIINRVRVPRDPE